MRSRRALKTTAGAVVALIMLGRYAVAQSESRSTDLSGTWVLDAQKSDFGRLQFPRVDTAVYQKSGVVYRVEEVGVVDSAVRITYSWPVGAGTTTSELSGIEGSILTEVKIKGDTARFVSLLRRKGITVEIQTGREYLSPDGRVRTREIDFQNLGNPNDDPEHLTLVFKKTRE